MKQKKSSLGLTNEIERFFTGSAHTCINNTYLPQVHNMTSEMVTNVFPMPKLKDNIKNILIGSF